MNWLEAKPFFEMTKDDTAARDAAVPCFNVQSFVDL